MTHAVQNQEQTRYGHPRPLTSLFFTELWERFSYYGIRPLLILYMTAIVADGGLGLDRASSAALVGVFAGSVYLMTIFGGWIADNWLGQVKSVWYGSMIIALGHLSIALSAFLDNFFFYFGLVLIVLGTGLFKTCIAVLVGSLYSATDTRRDAGFSIFYMGINIGAFCAPLITGLLVEQHAWHLGFGIGGIGMLIALVILRIYVIPQMQDFNQQQRLAETQQQISINNQSSLDTPSRLISKSNSEATPVQHPYAVKIVIGFLLLLGIVTTLLSMGILQINMVVTAQYMTVLISCCLIFYFIYFMLSKRFNPAEKGKLLLCFILILAAALFWSAFEQKPTTFNLFANDYTERMLMGFHIPTVWFQSLNAIFIVMLAPLSGWLWLRLGKANRDPSYMVKFSIALCFAALGFLVMALASKAVVAGGGALVSPLWLVSSILLLTLGELFLSPIGLSAITKLSPNMVRGQLMGLWGAAIALGNVIAGLIGGKMFNGQAENLAPLFMQCVYALCIGAILLLLLNPLIKKKIEKLQLNNE